MTYIAVPKEISSSEIIANRFSFSPTQYKRIILTNNNFLFVRDFLARKLTNLDLGSEVGSVNYINESPVYFFRTKGLQSHSYLPDENSESITPLNPKAFLQQNLKEGDLIISKDSNIGEAIILDRDYPNWMLSGALYRLPIKKHKYYLLAFIKHNFFREQLDFMVPMSATIRHAKTLFLDCKIPLPSANQEEVIEYVELLLQVIINKEKEIRDKHSLIHRIITEELNSNQGAKRFSFDYPTLDELLQVGRLDTARYTKEYKEFEHLITNYKGGFFNFSEKNYTVNRGQNLQVSNIGESVYSDTYIKGFYHLAVSSNFSEYSTLEKYTYLGNPRELKKIKKGDIIFSARGAQFGRVVFFTENINSITNIDNLVIRNETALFYERIFITMFINYMRWNKHIYKIALTGSGANSLTQYQFDEIHFPSFPEKKQKEIAILYHNPDAKFNSVQLTASNFLNQDRAFNATAGITELDKYIKLIQERLNSVLDQIVKDEQVEVDFSFLKSNM
jgi:hypothetical protein